MLIHKGLTATVAGESVPTHMAWESTNPLAVTVSFNSAGCDDWIQWIFSLDLMASGLTATALSRAGIGDVRVFTIGSPSGDLYMLYVNSPEGEATVAMSFELVQHFVQRVVTEFSAEDEARAVALQVDTFLRELNIESI